MNSPVRCWKYSNKVRINVSTYPTLHQLLVGRYLGTQLKSVWLPGPVCPNPIRNLQWFIACKHVPDIVIGIQQLAGLIEVCNTGTTC